MLMNHKLFAAALICVAALFSCTKPGNSGNNDNSGSSSTTPGKDEKVASAKVSYKFVTSDELLQYFDMQVKYWDPEKQTEMVIEKVTKSFLQSSFDTPLPGKMAIELKTALKEGVSIDDIKAKASISYLLPSVYYYLTLYNAAGEFISDGGWWGTETPEKAITKTGEEVVQRFNDKKFDKSYYKEFNEKGEFIHESNE